MKLHELYENLVEESLEKHTQEVKNHSYWMADLIIKISHDPAFKKLNSSLREEIETIVAAVEL